MLENIQKLRKKVNFPVLVFRESNLRYFCEVGNLSGFLLIDREETLITRDTDIAGLSPISNVIKSRERTFTDLLAFLKKNKIKRIGVDLDSMSYSMFRKFQSSEVKLVNISKTLSEIRAVKSKREIVKIKSACMLADKAMKEIEFYLKPGISERALRTRALSVLDDCEETAFNFIVASGPNSEYTHISPTQRKIKKKEFVLVDLGLKVDGYNSDLTRTFCIDPTAEQKRFYKTVLDAQEIALSAIKPNVSCKKVSESVEKFFKKKDLLKHWKYSLGHGVGVDIHESPYLSRDSKDKLNRGMVFTVEPGLHIPEFGGVRIEDTVLLADKARKLTKSDYIFEI